MSTVKLSAIRPNQDNPRTISGEALDRLKASIERDPQFMALRPIVIDETGTILGGNQRHAACVALGMTEIPDTWVRSAAGLTDEQRQRFVLLDNGPDGMTGSWDEEMLANLFPTGMLEDLGFDLADLDLDGLGTDGETDPDAVPDAPAEPDSQPGTIYQLGTHRLLCGDCTDPQNIARLLAGRTIDLVFTDPPYGVSYADKNAFLNAADKGNSNQTEIENDHMTLEDTGKLWSAVFEALATHLGAYSSYYVCTASSNGLLSLMLKTMFDSGMPYRHQLIWVKNNHVLGRCDYNYKHEPILYGWAERHKFYGHGDQKFSVWEYPKPQANKLHPTMKPVALVENAILNSSEVENAILNSSEKGMLVADPFLGSGSTLIAAESTGRVCYGTEISPTYCDVIRRRWAEFVHGEGCDWPSLTTEPVEA